MKIFSRKSNFPDEDLITNYCAFYKETVYYLYYYRRYIDYAKRWNSFLNGVVVILSLSAFSGLWLWEKCPNIWAIIIAVSQGLSAIAHLLPFQRQVDALNTFLPQLDDFIVQVEKDWYSLKSMSNKEILDLTSKRRLEYCALDQKFLGKISFFEKKIFSDYANESLENYMQFHALTK